MTKWILLLTLYSGGGIERHHWIFAHEIQCRTSLDAYVADIELNPDVTIVDARCTELRVMEGL